MCLIDFTPLQMTFQPVWSISDGSETDSWYYLVVHESLEALDDFVLTPFVNLLLAGNERKRYDQLVKGKNAQMEERESYFY